MLRSRWLLPRKTRTALPARRSRCEAVSSIPTAELSPGQDCGLSRPITTPNPRPRQQLDPMDGSSCVCRPGNATRRCARTTPCSRGLSPRPRGSGPAGRRPFASPVRRARWRYGSSRTARRSKDRSSTWKDGRSPAHGSRLNKVWFARNGKLSDWLVRAEEGSVERPVAGPR